MKCSGMVETVLWYHTMHWIIKSNKEADNGAAKQMGDETEYYGRARSQMDMPTVSYENMQFKLKHKNAYIKSDADEINKAEAYVSATLCYKRASVQGFLKKQTEKNGMFGNRTLKRYFTLDHMKGKMRIHKTNDPQSDYKLINYAEIQDVKHEP